MLKKGFRENRLHRWLESIPLSSRLVEAGVGHDAAIVAGARRLFLKSDQVVEGIHFSGKISAKLVGRKALCRALSDCAAVGGSPLFALASLAVPPSWNEERLRDFFRGLLAAGRKHGVFLVGGDLSKSRRDFVASVALVGSMEGAKPAGLRSRARPGHDLFVTGELGGSILGKHLRFVPRLKEGMRLRKRYRLGAIMDLSDGLAADLPRLCRASGVGAVVDAAAIPISPAARVLARRSGRSPAWHALCDGEDYELLWTAPPSETRRMLTDPVLRRAGIRKIGSISLARGIRLRGESGLLRPFPKGGYEHVGV